MGACSSQEYTAAKLAIQQSNFTKAAELLPKAIAVEPNNPEIPLVMAIEIYAQDGNWKNMVAMFDKAMAIDPDKEIEVRGSFISVKDAVANYIEFYWAKEFNIGVEQFKKIQDDPDNKPQYLEAAISHFQNAAVINPTDANTHATLAKCYFDKGDKEAAKNAALTAVEKNPDSFEANFAAGQIIARAGGTMDEILPLYEKAASIESSNSRVLRELAGVYYDLEQKGKSILLFKNAISYESDNIVKADLYFNLGVIYNQLGDYLEAEKAFDEAYYLNEDDFESALGMARSYEGLGDNYLNGAEGFEKDLDKAAKWYRKAEKKIKPVMVIDMDNRDKYKKALELIRYKRDVAEDSFSSKKISDKVVAKNDKEKYFDKKSKSKNKPVVKKSIKGPPNLYVEVDFSEPSNDGYLDAGEIGKIILTVINDGQGEAISLEPNISLFLSNPEISIDQFDTISILKWGSSESTIALISASELVKTDSIHLEINISEKNGFDLDPPSRLTIPTKAVNPPELVLADVAIINELNNNGRIEPREVVDALAIFHNRGQGVAKDVRISVLYGESIFNTSEQEAINVGDILPNERKEFLFSFFASPKAKEDLPIDLNIRDYSGNYDKTFSAGLSLNKTFKRPKELVFHGNDQLEIMIEDIESISIDIENNIPETSMNNPYGIAIVIGNSLYNGRVPNVDFASRDAEFVKEYLVKTLGYKPDNIFHYNNATLSNMNVAFNKMKNAVRKGVSDVFVYYTGHGAPDIESNRGFFVPVDADPNYIKETGYSIDELYKILNSIESKSTTVIIDACFSGESENGMILRDISPIFIEVEYPLIANSNITVITSSTGQQVSCWYRDKKHSLFTYYFLKAIQGDADSNSDGSLTLKEIKKYINNNVPYMAGRLRNIKQTPTFFTDNENKIFVEY